MPQARRDTDALTQQPNSSRGIIATIAACIVAALLIGGGWFAATIFESPQQREAKALPPEPKPIVAIVERGQLSDTVTVNATVSPASRADVAVPSAAEGTGFITATFARVGARLTNGQVVLEINGAPVFALTGAFPFYRDLAVGDTGPDVTQLQAALSQAGLNVTVDGTFGAATESAVIDLYARAGYEMPMRINDASQAQQPGENPTGDRSPVTSTTRYLPKSNMMVFRELPATVAGAPTTGAASGGDTVISVESGTTIARGAISAAVTATFTPGMEGTAELEGTTVPIRIDSIEPPADQGNEATVLVAAHTEASFPAEWVGKNVLLTLVRSQSSDNALIVPTRAIATDGGHGGTVLVQEADGSFRAVRVTEIAALRGLSAVEPVEGHVLNEGDSVRVG